MLTGVEDAAAYLDDIIAAGKSKQELTEQINIVQTCIQNFEFYLRPEKCHFYLQTIKYLGFIFNHQGHRPDPAKVAAIQQIPPPSDKSS